jgi:hypothetical protein
MSWFADEIEFEREIRDPDGKAAKVWLRPWSGGTLVELANRETANDDGRIAEGDFQLEGIMRSLIRWDLPVDLSRDNVKRLALPVYRQLVELVDEANASSAEPAQEDTPADPLPDSNGATTEPELAVAAAVSS